MSKYSYVFMCVQRRRDINAFYGYVKELRQMGFGSSVDFLRLLCLDACVGRKDLHKDYSKPQKEDRSSS